MSYIIPNPRWEQPALLTPGRKPVGPVTVDRSLAPNMMICSLFTDVTNSGCQNLADPGNKAIYNGTAFTASPLRYREHGLATEFHPSGGTNGADQVWFPDNRFSLSGDLTTYSDSYFQNISTNDQHWWWGVSGTDAFRTQLVVNDIVVSYIDNSPAQYDSSITPSPTISIDDRVQLLARKRGNTIDIWARINGGPILKSTPTTGGTGTLRTPANRYFSPVGAATSSTGHTEYLFGWVENVALSDGEATRRMLDPYYFLIPAG